MKLYAGIGSREADEEMMAYATQAAKYLAEQGYMLRSGGADGMDVAFQKGSGGRKNHEIFRPRQATEEAIKVAERFHAYWYNCNPYHKMLHGRNVQIILGRNLDDPVEFVLFWCPDETQGGTSMGLKVAKAHNIPTYNVENWVKENIEEE